MKSKKKTQLAYTEAIVIVVVLILVGVVFYFMQAKFSLSNSQLQESISYEFYYEYPTVVLQTFLHQKLTSAQKVEIGMNSEEEYLVRDLLVLDSQKSQELFTTLRSDFLDEYVLKDLGEGYSSLDYFLAFSQSSLKLEKQDLLVIVKNPSQVLQLRSYLRDNNFFYYYLTSSGDKVYLLFRKSSTDLVYRDFDATKNTLGGK